LDELRGQISAGEYAIESREVADEILTKFALVRRVTRLLMTEDEGEAGPRSPSRRRGASAPSPRTRREQLS
jgi:hypothetical protein